MVVIWTTMHPGGEKIGKLNIKDNETITKKKGSSNKFYNISWKIPEEYIFDQISTVYITNTRDIEYQNAVMRQILCWIPAQNNWMWIILVRHKTNKLTWPRFNLIVISEPSYNDKYQVLKNFVLTGEVYYAHHYWIFHVIYWKDCTLFIY